MATSNRCPQPPRDRRRRKGSPGRFRRCVPLAVLLAIGARGAALAQAVLPTPYTFLTIAGYAGYGTADGVGSAARFSGPEGIAVDDHGVFFVTDSYNSTLRSLVPVVLAGRTNWLVATLAGLAGSPGTNDGLGGAARFTRPNGVAVDTVGNLYVADTGNNTIRMANPTLVAGQTQWQVSTLAGLAGIAGSADGTNAAARFNIPTSLAVDAAGNLYVTDSGNATVRMIRPQPAGGLTNWVVSTIAGLAGSHGSADGTGSAARFFNLYGVAAGRAANLYVTDYGAGTIRALTPAGSAGQTNWTSSTIAGSVGGFGSLDGTNGAAQFLDPFGITLAPNGNLYVVDAGNETIRQIAPAVSGGQTNWVVATIAGSALTSGAQDGFGSAALFSYPHGIAASPAGVLGVADMFNNTIREVTSLGPGAPWEVSTIAGLAGGSGSADGTGVAARFDTPFGVTLDSSGALYVADSGNATLRRIVPVVSSGQTNWASSTIAGSAQDTGSADGAGANAQFSNPMGLAGDGLGHLYVADTANGTVRRVSQTVTAGETNWVVSTIAGSPGVSGAADGIGAAASFNNPSGIAAAGPFTVYVADSGNSLIRQVTAGVSGSQTQWIVTTIAGAAGLPAYRDGAARGARFQNPVGIALGPAGNLFVADTGNNTIRQMIPPPSAVEPTWRVSTIAGTAGMAGSADGVGAAARFNAPMALAFDGAGSLYVADFGNSTVRKLRPVGPPGQIEWVVTTIGGLAGNSGATDGTGTLARFAAPSGIALNGAGTLFLADANNDTLLMGFPPPYIILELPTVTNANAQISFSFLSGSPAGFTLLSAPQPAGPWTTNAAAVLSTNVPGLSYSFLIPLSPTTAQFYRVQRP